MTTKRTNTDTLNLSPVDLGERVKMLRGAHGWSRVALAERSGVSVSTIERWELGTVDPLRNARGIASALGLSLAELVGSDSDSGDAPTQLARLTADLEALAARAGVLRLPPHTPPVG